jgi:hypothetical protein
MESKIMFFSIKKQKKKSFLFSILRKKSFDHYYFILFHLIFFFTLFSYSFSSFNYFLKKENKYKISKIK